jgi:geranylgeranyl diphosphate synthase type I
MAERDASHLSDSGAGPAPERDARRGVEPDGRQAGDPTAVAEAQAYLAERAEPVNAILRRFWREKERAWDTFPKIIREAFTAYEILTADGKKIRAGLVRLGYDVCVGPHSPPATAPDGIDRAAASVEILHNAFLIHDDIVDQSDLRRNKPTAHRRYADASRSRFRTDEEALTYGRAVALNFGDKGQALAQELLLSSGFPDHLMLPALRLLSLVTAETVAGQLLDVNDVRLEDLTEELVLRIHEYKTAHYTVMLPLQMGAMLAGAPSGVLPGLRAFAIPLGIAFQIQDDILGLFGDEHVLGKPVVSDVREGKKTLLMVHAYARAVDGDRAALERAHGNPRLTPHDLEDVRGIVRRTGALAQSEEMARAFVESGKRHISAITRDTHWRRILGGLADYLIVRRY